MKYLILLFVLGCATVHKIPRQFASNQESVSDPVRYEAIFGGRVFNHANGHSFLLYPLNQSYPKAFADTFDSNPEIKRFFEKTKSLEQCMRIYFEVLELGRDEVEHAQWDLAFIQNGKETSLDFVEVVGVAPRIHMKHRLSQFGRETWWVNETYACAQEKLNIDSDFDIVIKSKRYESLEYNLSFRISE